MRAVSRISSYCAGIDCPVPLCTGTAVSAFIDALMPCRSVSLVAVSCVRRFTSMLEQTSAKSTWQCNSCYIRVPGDILIIAPQQVAPRFRLPQMMIKGTFSTPNFYIATSAVNDFAPRVKIIQSMSIPPHLQDDLQRVSSGNPLLRLSVARRGMTSTTLTEVGDSEGERRLYVHNIVVDLYIKLVDHLLHVAEAAPKVRCHTCSSSRDSCRCAFDD